MPCTYKEGNVVTLRNATAKLIADSVCCGNRITTIELEYPRIIHCEMLTHRMFSRNAQSSRATPVATLIKSVKAHPYVPDTWRRAQKGMVAGEEFNADDSAWLTRQWKLACANAISAAEALNQIHAAKEHVNRLLEPFSFIKVLVTATEWQNFLNLRLAPDAQPEIRDVAQCIRELLADFEPVERDIHAPYVSSRELRHLWSDLPDEIAADAEREHFLSLLYHSVACCARVSYLKFDGKNPTDEENFALTKRLLAQGHLTPFEHFASAGQSDEFYANFRGWQSGRWLAERAREANLEEEERNDE